MVSGVQWLQSTTPHAPGGHRALLIFPLAAMLMFCQIIRKLDRDFFLTQSLQSCH